MYLVEKISMFVGCCMCVPPVVWLLAYVVCVCRPLFSFLPVLHVYATRCLASCLCCMCVPPVIYLLAYVVCVCRPLFSFLHVLHVYATRCLAAYLCCMCVSAPNRHVRFQIFFVFLFFFTYGIELNARNK